MSIPCFVLIDCAAGAVLVLCWSASAGVRELGAGAQRGSTVLERGSTVLENRCWCWSKLGVLVLKLVACHSLWRRRDPHVAGSHDQWRSG